MPARAFNVAPAEKRDGDEHSPKGAASQEMPLAEAGTHAAALDNIRRDRFAAALLAFIAAVRADGGSP